MPLGVSARCLVPMRTEIWRCGSCDGPVARNRNRTGPSAWRMTSLAVLKACPRRQASIRPIRETGRSNVRGAETERVLVAMRGWKWSRGPIKWPDGTGAATKKARGGAGREARRSNQKLTMSSARGGATASASASGAKSEGERSGPRRRGLDLEAGRVARRLVAPVDLLHDRGMLAHRLDVVHRHHPRASRPGSSSSVCRVGPFGTGCRGRPGPRRARDALRGERDRRRPEEEERRVGRPFRRLPRR